METKHTPGPWTAWDDDGTGTLPCVLAEQVTTYGNFYVAQCNVFDDARLISAAPDLLDACLWLLKSAGYENGEALPSLRELSAGRQHFDRALAAVRKATAAPVPPRLTPIRISRTSL